MAFDTQSFLTVLFNITSVSTVFYFVILCAIEASRRKEQGAQRPKMLRQMALPPAHRRIPLNISNAPQETTVTEETPSEIYEYINV